MTNVHFSSRTGRWDTPASLITDLSTVFHWDLDVCAEGPNICDNYYDEEDDGLSKPWRGLCWMNPPYGRSRHIDKWMFRAKVASIKKNTTIVCLPPARTGTIWWHSNVMYADLLVFIKGRLTFGSDVWWEYLWSTPVIDGKKNPLFGKHGHKNCAPFPSAFVVFGDLTVAQEDKLCSYGMAYDCAFNSEYWNKEESNGINE